MNSITIRSYQSSIGELILGDHAGRLCLLDYRYRRLRAAVDRRLCVGLKAHMQEGNTALLEQAVQAIDAFLRGQRMNSGLPLLTVGSAFQKLVWDALVQVPYGTTVSYGELARRIGRPDAVRAVASANGANSIALLIPCHRIIGSQGELVGYAGGLAVKKRLLTLEGALTPECAANSPRQQAFAFPPD